MFLCWNEGELTVYSQKYFHLFAKHPGKKKAVTQYVTAKIFFQKENLILINILWLLRPSWQP
jgi:hypothetical protein